MKKALFLKSASSPMIVQYVEIMDNTFQVIDTIIEPITKEFQPSKHLFDAIDGVMRRNNLEYKQLDQLYVASGPGSYTGARLLVTIVKTIHFLNSTIEVFDASILAIFEENSLLNCESKDIPVYSIAYARKNKYYFSGIEDDKKIEDCLLSTDEVMNKTETLCYINGVLFESGLSDVDGIPIELDVHSWIIASKKVEDIVLYEPYYLEEVNIG